MVQFQCLILLFSIVWIQETQCKIGELAVKKAKSLILNKAQRDQCNLLIPEAGSCDQAYQTVDKYCDEKAANIDKECDESFKRLVDKCNTAEKSIKERCKKENGYVTAECGRLFERLDNVCRIVSSTQSRHCTKLYRKMDNECYKKYSKITLKCKRIFDRYKDFCESDMSPNYWNEAYKDGEFNINESKIKIEVIKNMAEEENFFEEKNIKKYVNLLNEKKEESKKTVKNTLKPTAKPERTKSKVKNTVKPINKLTTIKRQVASKQISKSQKNPAKKSLLINSMDNLHSENKKIEPVNANSEKKSLLNDFNMEDIEELFEKAQPVKVTKNPHSTKKPKSTKNKTKNPDVKQKKPSKKTFLDNFNIENALAEIIEKADPELKRIGKKRLENTESLEKKNNQKPLYKKPVSSATSAKPKTQAKEANKNKKPAASAAGKGKKKPAKKSLMNENEFEDIEEELFERNAPIPISK